MLFKKKDIQQNEHFRLMTDIERARKSLAECQRTEAYQTDIFDNEILYLLAEVRYRCLAAQARKRNYSNQWYLYAEEQRSG